MEVLETTCGLGGGGFSYELFWGTPSLLSFPLQSSRAPECLSLAELTQSQELQGILGK